MLFVESLPVIKKTKGYEQMNRTLRLSGMILVVSLAVFTLGVGSLRIVSNKTKVNENPRRIGIASFDINVAQSGSGCSYQLTSQSYCSLQSKDCGDGGTCTSWNSNCNSETGVDTAGEGRQGYNTPGCTGTYTTGSCYEDPMTEECIILTTDSPTGCGNKATQAICFKRISLPIETIVTALLSRF